MSKIQNYMNTRINRFTLLLKDKNNEGTKRTGIFEN